MQYIPGDFTAFTVLAGPALTAQGKAIYCSGVSGSLACLAFGLNTNTIANGVVATVNVTLAAQTSSPSIAIGIGGTLGSMANATAAPVVGTGGTITVQTSSPPLTGGPSLLQGLIGYWNFDEGTGNIAHDTSGSGYNATVTGGATWTSGKINSALSFNGVTSDVVTPNIAMGNAFSISAWVNPALTWQGPYSRIAETQYNGGMYLGTDLSGTRYKFIVNTGIGSTGSCGVAFGCAEGGMVTNGWHLVTATFDGATAQLYVDNVLVARDTFTAPGNTNYPLNIGRYYGAAVEGWNGVLDEVRLYNRALSSADVTAIYNYSGPSLSQGLIGYWNFDEGTGNIAHDTSGSGYNATVTGGATWTSGKINSALSFNGVTSDVVTPNIAMGNAFSISAWVNPAVTWQGPYSRIAETQYNGGMYLGTDLSGTRYKFIVNTGAGSTGSCGAAFGCAEGGMVTYGWHLVTATFDGATAQLYVDNVLVARDTFTAPGNTNYPLNIGRYYGAAVGGWNGAWNGVLDEVRLYNRALTAAEVNSWYLY